MIKIECFIILGWMVLVKSNKLSNLAGEVGIVGAPADPEIENPQTRPGSITDSYFHYPYSSLAYCSPQELEGWKCTDCHKIGQQAKLDTIIKNKPLDAMAYIVTDSVRQEIVISFRGTHSVSNGIYDLLVVFDPIAPNQRVRVHAGFKRITESLQPVINVSLNRLLRTPKFSNYRVVLVGHSLGGAVAVLSALYLQKHHQLPWSQIYIYTYGQPRVGNREFVQWFSSFPMTVSRVVNEDDPIPHFPPAIMGYSHIFTEIYIKDGNARICSQYNPEDPTCSNSRILSLNQRAHDTAWDQRLTAEGCRPYSVH